MHPLSKFDCNVNVQICFFPLSSQLNHFKIHCKNISPSGNSADETAQLIKLIKSVTKERDRMIKIVKARKRGEQTWEHQRHNRSTAEPLRPRRFRRKRVNRIAYQQYCSRHFYGGGVIGSSAFSKSTKTINRTVVLACVLWKHYPLPPPPPLSTCRVSPLSSIRACIYRFARCILARENGEGGIDFTSAKHRIGITS